MPANGRWDLIRRLKVNALTYGPSHAVGAMIISMRQNYQQPSCT